MNFWTILVALAVFLLLILFHESGHFIAAKCVGIKVNEFSVGMGPKLLQRQKGETVYSLRLLPIGGYCAMEGEESDSEDPRAFRNARPWKRFLTILAGPAMNVLIAMLAFTVYLFVIGKAVPTIAAFTEHSPLPALNVQVGDIVLAADGKTVETIEDLKSILQDGRGEPMTLEIRKSDGKVQDVTVQPIEVNGEWMLGLQGTPVRDPLYALAKGAPYTFSMFRELAIVLGKLLTGRLSLSAVSGPVGVVRAIGDAAQNGFLPLLYFFGFISANLAFFNLLPIPALDGSKLWLIALEKLRGKPLSEKVEMRISMAGFALLLLLILAVSVKDVLQLF